MVEVDLVVQVAAVTALMLGITMAIVLLLMMNVEPLAIKITIQGIITNIKARNIQI